MVRKIGLISDTHGRLDPRAVSFFEREQVGAIIHAGDIGGHEILWELNAVAPVTAVLGNNDYAGVPGWALDPVARLSVSMTPEGSEGTSNIDLVDVRIAVVHVLGHLKPIPSDVDVVVSGHTHIPSAIIDPRSGALCVNPGSASRPRTGTGPTVGILECRSNSAGQLVFRVAELASLL